LNAGCGLDCFSVFLFFRYCSLAIYTVSFSLYCSIAKSKLSLLLKSARSGFVGSSKNNAPVCCASVSISLIIFWDCSSGSVFSISSFGSVSGL